jgi:hypothetical protein
MGLAGSTRRYNRMRVSARNHSRANILHGADRILSGAAQRPLTATPLPLFPLPWGEGRGALG